MNEEKISIIIPCYNSTKTIIKCLDSIFNQSYKNLEIIVVDDGSTDDLLGLLINYGNKLIVLQQENKGAPAARNYGFKVSGGEFVIFLDADIVMKPQMIEKMYLALKSSPESAFTYSAFKFGWKKFKLWPFDFEKLKEMPYIHTSSLIRREFFPGFDESLKKFQDWDLFLTIAKKGNEGIFIPEVLFKIKSGGTMSSWFPKLFFKSKIKSKKIKEEVDKYNQSKIIIKNKHEI